VVEAAIFDMDGLLIDSEPFWREVEIPVFRGLGVPLTEEMCAETMGLRVNEVVAHWRRQFPWDGPGDGAVVEQIVSGVIHRIQNDGVLMDGVVETIDLLRARGLRLAIASSSLYRVIAAVLDRFDIESAFDVVHSAEDEDRGKPDPAVYLTAAAKLAVAPEACVALEDSVNGVLSAKAAGMTVIAVPDASVRDDTRFEAADITVTSLRDLDAATWDRLLG
jgi:HAD superfamily hydrolase (TIGR01509 family)